MSGPPFPLYDLESLPVRRARRYLRAYAPTRTDELYFSQARVEVNGANAQSRLWRLGVCQSNVRERSRTLSPSTREKTARNRSRSASTPRVRNAEVRGLIPLGS